MHFSLQQKQRVINGQRFGRRFPLHPPFYLCWTILVGRISSVKWTGVQPVALRLGVIIFLIHLLSFLIYLLSSFLLLSYPSSLLLWLLFACCGLRRLLSIGFKRALLFVFFPRPAPNYPSSSTCPSFSTTAPALIQTIFPILQR